MTVRAQIIRFVTGRSAKRFEEATRDPARTQRELLAELLSRNADTAYGRKYDFASIRDYPEYRKRVPVVTYQDIKADMDRVVETGADRIFTAEQPAMFAQTSGTTGTPKYIPVTPSELHGWRHKHVMQTWLWNAQQAHPDIFDRSVVSLVSPAIEGQTPSGIPYGSTSGHIYRNNPAIVRGVYCIPYEVFEIADYEARYYTIMRLGVEKDVRFLATANPSSVLKMVQKADEHSEKIIRDIRDGTLADSFDIEAPIRAAVQRLLVRNPARAARLEEARQRRDGRLLAGDYWGRMSLIGCWKGGTVGHYIDKFASWFRPDGGAPVAVRDMGYLASELRGSVPVSDEGSRGVLTIATNFYEFATVDDVAANPDNPAAWNPMMVDALEDGREYYLLATTAAGLYRYDINDIIRVDGFHNRTPQIVFLRKGRGMSNLTGEKISVNQIISAFQSACESTAAAVAHFKAEADADASRYILRAEFAAEPPGGREPFLRAVDDTLKSLNIEYKSKRASGRLRAPVLHVMREGWYERERQRQVAGGKRMFQAKTELLSIRKAETTMVRPELLEVVELDE